MPAGRYGHRLDPDSLVPNRRKTDQCCETDSDQSCRAACMHASQPELNRSVAGIVHVAYLFRLQEGGGWVSGVESGKWER